MSQTGEALELRIYVACLAAYNNGILNGAWIDVGDDADAVWAGVNAMLKASPIPLAEEFAIHDHEDFGGVEIGEYAGVARVVEIAAFLRQRGALGALVLKHFNGDIEETGEALDDNYRGAFRHLADYVQELTEETVTIPESLRNYIDYEAIARDAEINGDFFTIEAAGGEVHFFWGR
ncbi:antirestriction protein ArdA [Caulobacter sp. SL161]|uniref:antirestriction protein ArdA n=1 Tax=Caulobacter sp. SL161 TaxID=2995156 RepID=UPI002274B6AD|nr:antirestriction protein ArdA [Caulobacter sp. SL161]MCY1646653.1 antirestriction protein ArdA [Caulobacter sp. SL161]